MAAAAPASSPATSSTLSVDNVRRWSTADVAVWLHSVRLEAHAATFEANDINGQVILDVDKNALKQMGITAVGERVRLDKAIRDLKRAASVSSFASSSGSLHGAHSTLASSVTSVSSTATSQGGPAQSSEGRAKASSSSPQPHLHQLSGPMASHVSGHRYAILPPHSATDTGASSSGLSPSWLAAAPTSSDASANVPSMTASGPNAFSSRRSAHQRPPPLQLAHSANYALPGSVNADSSSTRPAAAASESLYYASGSSGAASSSTGSSTASMAGHGNPLTHSLFANAHRHLAATSPSQQQQLLTPGQQQAAAQAAPVGPPPTTVIGSGWTAHPAQRVGIGAASAKTSVGPSANQHISSAGTRQTSPTYPPSANATFRNGLHRDQMNVGQVTANVRPIATGYGDSPHLRNTGATSYGKHVPVGPATRAEKTVGMYGGSYGSHVGYHLGGSGSRHAHHLSASSNSSASGGSGLPGHSSTLSSPTTAIFNTPTARPEGFYGGSDESGLDGSNSPYIRTPTTPSYPHAMAPASETGTSVNSASHAHSGQQTPRIAYHPVGLGGSSLSSGTMYTLDDVKRRTLKFHCEDLGSTRTIPVSDCRDAYDVLARVLRKFGIRGGSRINAYPPYHDQDAHDSESEDDDVGIANSFIRSDSGSKWAIFASSPDGKTKMLSDNELIAICHAPQPHDPLRERGLHLRRIGPFNGRPQQARRHNKLNKFFGESDVPEAGSAAAGAGQVSPGHANSLGRESNYDSEAQENLAPLSSNANRKPKMNRASTISFMSGLGLGGPGRTTTPAEREPPILQQQQQMALHQYREQYAREAPSSGYPHPAAAIHSTPGVLAPAAFSNERSAPLQPPPVPSPVPSAAIAAAAAAAAAAANTSPSSSQSPSQGQPSASSMLGLLPRRARNFFGQRPPSELISSNLQDYFPAAEKKVLERTARRSIYGRASTRSKRDSTWSFKHPEGNAGSVDDEEPMPLRRSADSYYDETTSGQPRRATEIDADDTLQVSESSTRPRAKRTPSTASSRSGTSSEVGRSASGSTSRSRLAKAGPPTLPPVIGRSSLDDWSASLQTVGSPTAAQDASTQFDSVPDTPTATAPSRGSHVPASSTVMKDDKSLTVPSTLSTKSSKSGSPSSEISPVPSSSHVFSSPGYSNKSRSIRRNSGESSRSRRSFARFQAHGPDRDRSDAVSLLTVDEITQDIESRSENALLFALGAEGSAGAVASGGVVDGDGNPVPTRKSMTGRWTGDTDSMSILSKRPPTIMLTDDDHSSIAARSLRSLKRNRSSASRKRRLAAATGSTGSGRNSVAGDRKAAARDSMLHGLDDGGGKTAASAVLQASPAIEEDEGEGNDEDDDDDDLSDDYDDDFDEEDEDEVEAEEAGETEVAHPAHRAGKARRKWIKGALIGAGSFGSVYLGMDQRTGLYMAVKQVELPTGKSDNEQRKMSMLEALEREIALLKTLEHPNIVQYLDSYADDSHLNIFLEYVPGGSVVAILRDWGTFQEPLVQAYITQTLLGLQFLHERNIVHSDIKGANILVDTKGQIKISDFGISKKDTDELIASGDKAPKKTALQGSIFWMAPEAVKQTSYSRKADIWSVGCLVVEMLTGTHPWPTLNQMQALFRIGSMKATPPMPEDISANCRAFLNWTFELDHTKRPTAEELSAHRFLTEVAALEPDEPAEAPMATSTPNSSRGALNTMTGVRTAASSSTMNSIGRKGKGGRRRPGGASSSNTSNAGHGQSKSSKITPAGTTSGSSLNAAGSTAGAVLQRS